MTDIITIDNISEYTLDIIGNKLILTPKKDIITEEEFEKIDLAKSSILEYKILDITNNIISNNISNKYKTILIDIWLNTPFQEIIKHTTFNIKLTNKYGKKGYYWHDELKFSSQNKDSNGTMKEIIKMCKINNYILDITIKLQNSKIIYFKTIL